MWSESRARKEKDFMLDFESNFRGKAYYFLGNTEHS